MSALTDTLGLRLLEILEKKPRLSPKLLVDETGLSYQKIKTTLRTLAEVELVKTPSRGVYVITEAGRRHLQQIQGESK